MSQDNQTLSLGAVRKYFASPRPHYLSPHEAIAYVAMMLIDRDVYGSQLIADIGTIADGSVRLSDTVLHRALSFFKEQGLVETYEQKVGGDDQGKKTKRGRPRVMYRENLQGENAKIIKELASYWRYGKPTSLAKAG